MQSQLLNESVKIVVYLVVGLYATNAQVEFTYLSLVYKIAGFGVNKNKKVSTFLSHYY